MKAYFVMNNEVYKDDSTTVLIFLNKMSKGRGDTFTEGWYLKLANLAIPDSEKTFKKICKVFEEVMQLAIDETAECRSQMRAWR